MLPKINLAVMELPSYQALISGLGGALIAVWVLKLIGRAYFTPLRGIPGPWHAPLTCLWLKKQTLAGRRTQYVHDMHIKFGSVVRISPEEVSVSDTTAFKEIHRIGGNYRKSPWYQSFRQGEVADLFSMLDPREHAQRRKLLAPLLSNSALMRNWFDTIVDKLNLTITKMKHQQLQQGKVDIFMWWTFMTADVISHLAFGEPLGMLDQERKTEHMQKIEDAIKLGLVGAELPFVRSLLEWTPIRSVQDMVNADAEVQSLARDIMTKTMRDGIGSTNIFSKMVAEKDKDAQLLSDYQLAYEAGGLIVAGSGTTAVSLTYLVWAVLSRPAVQARLEAEVENLPTGFSDSNLEALPYLSAVIEETLRLYGAAPGALPRVVPGGGARLAGYFIPQGTTVSTQSYTYHRDPQTYPEPEEFLPERFLNASGQFEAPKTGVYAPFGAGSRTCIGIHLARIELRHGAAFFFRECKGARLAPETTPLSMEMVNYFLMSPRSEKCWVTLLK
ncbi:cytochrome P450 [Fusarium agapanthi]|uniref:Cytochrome P450 n=1 Tax=Fusarium agapanthi TaxID=1803897 RepID=A0A9P5B1T0_9HYPO|nr:cytochrome P450 [Fusarium agapanthi]